jgi:hypothetical protein
MTREAHDDGWFAHPADDNGLVRKVKGEGR